MEPSVFQRLRCKDFFFFFYLQDQPKHGKQPCQRGFVEDNCSAVIPCEFCLQKTLYFSARVMQVWRGEFFFPFLFFLVILTMVHHSLQSLDDGIHGGIVFFSELQERKKEKKNSPGRKDYRRDYKTGITIYIHNG